MNTKTLFFIGPPGSGKGTQAKLIVDFLRSETEEKVLHVEMGAHFRDLAQIDTETGHLVKHAQEVGEILPAFLATSFWTKVITQELTVNSHLVIDGSPRTRLEAVHLGEAVRFYDRAPATIVYLPISSLEIYKRLTGRHRDDDRKQITDTRLAEYKAKTEPAIAFCTESADFNLVTIDGEQTIEAIHEQVQDILL
jgi:adenylate kinase